MTRDAIIVDLRERVDMAWEMAAFFLRNKDAHGIHDAGVEIQALDRALKEMEKLT